MMIGHEVLREGDFELDLESGGNTSDSDGMSGPVLGNGQSRKLMGRVWNGSLSFVGLVSLSNLQEGHSDANLEFLIDKNSKGEDNQQWSGCLADGNHKEDKRATRKPPKPPRPPKGLSLDAADKRLVQEITELAIRKRAQIERIKALKKMRAEKTSSSAWSNNLPAMVITVLFLLVIIFQGIGSHGSENMSLQASSEPSAAGGGRANLISVQFFQNISAYETDIPGSTSLRFAEKRVSESSSRKT